LHNLKNNPLLFWTVASRLAFLLMSVVWQPHIQAPAVSIEIRLRPEITAIGETLMLGDVSEIHSSDASQAEKLKAISLGYAPNVSTVRELERERIGMAVRSAGFRADGFVLTGATRIIVRRASQLIDPAQVREAIERTILAQFNASAMTARLSRLELPPQIEAPSGAIEISASVGNAQNLFAPFTVLVDLRIGQRIVGRFHATAQVEAHAAVLTAARDLSAGGRALRDDFVMSVERLDHPLAAYVRDESLLRGRSLRHSFARGEVLTMDALVAGIIMRPGDTVRILAQQGNAASGAGIQIIVAGEARAAGRIGDRIQVRNAASGAMLQAVIVDEGLVRVDY
jgi:flagella basal body P-ring formation protein FlgA